MSKYHKGARGLRRSIRQTHFDRQNGICVYCACKMRKKFKSTIPNSATLEHILPMSMGGPNWLINTIAVCYGCNRDRGHERLTPEKINCILAAKGPLGYIPIIATTVAHMFRDLKISLFRMQVLVASTGLL